MTDEIKQKIKEILEREIPAILTEMAFLGAIPKEKGHHQGFSKSQVVKNNTEIIADQISQLFDGILVEKAEEVEKLKERFKCAACDGAKCEHTQCCQALAEIKKIIT